MENSQGTDPRRSLALTEAQQRAAEQRVAAERKLEEALELERRLADEAERDAAEHAGVCAENVERLAAQRAQAESHLNDASAAEAAARSAAAAASEALTARRAAREELAMRLGGIQDRAVAEPPSAPSTAFGGLSALEALAQFDPGEPPAELAVPAPRSRSRGRVALVAAVLAAAAIAAIALLRPIVPRPAIAQVVHVCPSASAARFAADVVRAYADTTRLPAARFDLSGRGPCDVRFSAKRSATDGDLVGGERIVAVNGVRLAVTVDSTSRNAVAVGLAGYARSGRAQAVVARDGSVPN